MGLVDSPGTRKAFRLKQGTGRYYFSDFSVASLSLFVNFLWDPAQDYRRPIKRTELKQGEPCRRTRSTA